MKLKKIIILLLIVLILLCIGIVLLKKSNQNKQDESNVVQHENVVAKKEVVNTDEMEQVKSAPAFFTIQNCVNKYIDYILQENSEAVYKVLDTEYIKKNDITSDNILDKIPKVESDVVFSAEKMYFKQLDDSNLKYYTTGILEKGHGDGEESENEQSGNEIVDSNFSITVILNIDKLTFSIIP